MDAERDRNMNFRIRQSDTLRSRAPIGWILRRPKSAIPLCRVSVFAVLALAILSGCQQQTVTPIAENDQELMDELLGEPDASRDRNAAIPPESTGGPDSFDQISPRADNPGADPESAGSVNASTVSRSRSIPGARNGSGSDPGSRAGAPRTPTAKGERLELRMQAGDRFPMMKTVEQTLMQKSEEFPAVARTRLSMTLAIQVEDVRSDAILMSVRYNRIAYAHDLNGERLEYDSAVHQNDIPHDVQPYAGMINNGFSFWIGRDNKIRELVGYNEFLQRCVQNMTGDRKESLLTEISNRFGDDGVANFIDDSIGLLPYDSSVDAESATRVAPGDVWTREQRMLQPAPIYLTTTYRLMSIDERTAEIDITGRIASGETVQKQDSASLRIVGGHCIGRCTVDRATGLPLEMDQTRYLNMVVTTADGAQIPQDKTILTTIRAFPEMKRPSVMVPNQGAGAVQPAGGNVSQFGGGVTQIPVNSQAPGSQQPAQQAPVAPVQAVYPD